MKKSYRARLVPAFDAHYAAIVAMLHAKLFPKTQFPSPHYGDWWVVYFGNEPVGFSHLVQSTHYPDGGYFSRVGVLPPHRGNGLQARLMIAAEIRARSFGWGMMYSDTRRAPYSAANFEKLKYSRFKPENPWGQPGTVYWRKEL